MLKRLYIVSIIFLLLSPLYVKIMKPHNDIIYYFLKKEPVEINSKTINDNEFYQFEGNIESESLILRTKLFQTKLAGCIFRIEELPENIIFHLRKGPLFEQVKSIYENSNNEDSIFNIINHTESSSSVKEFLFSKKIRLKGRSYSSNNLLEPFQNYYFNKELDIDHYFYEIGEKFHCRANIVNFFAKQSGEPIRKDVYYVIQVDETPRLKNIVDTSLSIFIFVLFIYTTGTIYLVFGIRKKDK
ncbi:MAG: hypothetical protein MJB14_17715 [Spirochaetes bacterium]|nr:hypothetical protein [Spirochaetota bacterium]